MFIPNAELQALEIDHQIVLMPHLNPYLLGTPQAVALVVFHLVVTWAALVLLVVMIRRNDL